MTGKKSSAQPPPLLCNQHPPPPSLPPSKLRAPLLPLPRHHAASRQSRPDRAWRDTRPPTPPYHSAAHSCFLPPPLPPSPPPHTARSRGSMYGQPVRLPARPSSVGEMEEETAADAADGGGNFLKESSEGRGSATCCLRASVRPSVRHG